MATKLDERTLIDSLAYIRAVPAETLEREVLGPGAEIAVSSIEVVTMLVKVGKQIGIDLATGDALGECGRIRNLRDLEDFIYQLARPIN